MNTLSLEHARRRYADALRGLAPTKSEAVIGAFAKVPREAFLGPPPWTLLSPDAPPIQTDDPRDLYRNVLVPIDRARQINNGEPRLWAYLFDLLDLTPRERVLHVGAGTGYYSAILAEILGKDGALIAIEIEPDLAARAKQNLMPWPQATVVCADGFAFRPDPPVHAIVVNAGVSRLSAVWLDSLRDSGKLLVPLTTSQHWIGAFLLITRLGTGIRYSVRYACPTSIIPCAGGGNTESEARLNAALYRAGFAAIRSLRRAPEDPDETCWLAGDGWWFSTAPP